jgi:hypothetical protein
MNVWLDEDNYLGWYNTNTIIKTIIKERETSLENLQLLKAIGLEFVWPYPKPRKLVVTDRAKLLAWLDQTTDYVMPKMPPGCDVFPSTTDAITRAIQKSSEMWDRTHALERSRHDQLWNAGLRFELGDREVRLVIFHEPAFNAWRTSDLIVEVMKLYEDARKRKADKER